MQFWSQATRMQTFMKKKQVERFPINVEMSYVGGTFSCLGGNKTAIRLDDKLKKKKNHL